MKKGRIGIVTATRNSGTRSSPFASKRRFPSHGWDHKIDLESIEADATSHAQPSQNQLTSVNRPLASSALTLKQPNQYPERNICKVNEAAKTNNENAVQGATTAVNVESAFTGVTKHSAKMRRRLKRKQRKRSATTSEGIEGGIPDTSTSGSEDGTPSQRADDSSRRESKKESRSSTDHHRPTVASTDAAAVSPTRPRSSQETQEDTDTVLHSRINRSPREMEPKPVKSTMKDVNRMPSTSAPRGKTIVEILSHIGEQTPYPSEVSTSLKPDESGNLGEDCSVSIIVEELEDGRRTAGGLDSKLQATTSQLTHGATMEKNEKSADYFSMMAASVEHGRPSSPASSSRLNVTNTIGDGLLLRRSHSCGEMRRRMVLTEYEVVTTTNTEVIVTETGPTSPQVETGASSDNETSGSNVKSGLLSETRDHDGLTHDSRKQTLGLAKNLVGHRRSKSSDDRTRSHIDDAATAESRGANNLSDAQHANDCLMSSIEPNELCSTDDPKAGTAIQQTPQCSEESKTEPDVSDLSLLETRVALVREFSMVNQLSQSSSEQAIATYTLSNPGFVDKFRSEERWAMGLDADLVLDYRVVDVVEKIRLRTDGNDVSDQGSDDLDDQEQTIKSFDKQYSVTEYSEVMFPEQKTNENESGLCEEVELSSGAPHQVQCQPTENGHGTTDQQRSTSGNIVKNEVVCDTDGSAVKREETHDNVTTCPVESIRDDQSLVDRQADCVGSVSQPRAKEDEDSEEKEADEAESREAECEESEEKGMMELNYSIVEKTGCVHEESGNTLQNAERVNGENGTAAQLEHVSDDIEDCSVPSTVNGYPSQVEGSVTKDNAVRPDALLSPNVGVGNNTSLSNDVTEVVGQQNLDPQSESHPEISDHMPVAVGTHISESDAHDNGLSAAVGEHHLAETATCPSEPRVDSSSLLDPELDPNTVADTEIESESNRTKGGCSAAETGQSYGEKAEDEERVMPVVRSVEMMENRQDNTVGEYQIADVDVMFRAETLSTLGHEEQTEADPGPPATSNDHTQRIKGSLTVTSTTTTNDTDDLESKNVCISTATGTWDDENSETADNPVRSSTFAHRGTSLFE